MARAEVDPITLQVISGALDTIAEELAARPGLRFKLVANLPYNVGTELLELPEDLERRALAGVGDVLLVGQTDDQDLGVSDSAMGFLTGFAFALVYTVAGIPNSRSTGQALR